MAEGLGALTCGEDTEERSAGLFVGPLGEGVSHTQSKGMSGRMVVWMALGTIREDFQRLTGSIWCGGKSHLRFLNNTVT